MKKPRSIFFKIALIVTPIVLALDFFLLLLSYNITYDNTMQSCRSQLRNAANSAVQYTETSDVNDPEVREYLCADFSSLCKLFDISYVYAIDLDVEKNTETFIAIGFGDDAGQKVKETRYPGVKVEGSITKEEREAYNGNKDGVFSFETTPFEDSLICYMPCTRSFNYQTGKYNDRDKPIIIGTEMSITSVMRNFRRNFRLIAVLTVILTVGIVVLFASILYFRVSMPIRKLSERMSSFVTDRENEKNIEKLVVEGNNEFSLMADSFNIMTEEIDRYINDIDELSREKHTQEAELNIANNIQMGLLQPDFENTDSCMINSVILPARNVGGDLYDYCILDDGRVWVAIADVSGKGISAALFMSRAITLLHQYMQMDYTPAKILEEFNNTMAAQNPGGMFITTFLAIWDPSAGRLTYSNAGHNIPYLLSDTLIPLEGAHGVAAGLFSGETYEEACISVKAGDTLFLYTDGVNEAKNAGGAFYTTERLEEKLAGMTGSGSTDSLNQILDDLKSFVQDAEQSDDITMLTLHIKQLPAQTVLRVPSEVSQLIPIREAINKLPVSDDLKKTLYLAAEEIFVNICSYAYDASGEVEFSITLDDRVGLTFADSGKPFDPTADVPEIDEYDHENQIGGLGRFLTFSIVDEYHYEYRDGRNILALYFERGD